MTAIWELPAGRFRFHQPSSTMRAMTAHEAPGMMAHSVPEISREELRRRLDDRTLTIVNVLAREAWLQERIPGSLSLPVAEIPARAEAMLRDKEAEIAVHCASPT